MGKSGKVSVGTNPEAAAILRRRHDQIEDGASKNQRTLGLPVPAVGSVRCGVPPRQKDDVQWRRSSAGRDCQCFCGLYFGEGITVETRTGVDSAILIDRELVRHRQACWVSPAHLSEDMALQKSRRQYVVSIQKDDECSAT